MKITIAKKYRHKFKDDKAFVSRWKNRSILITNQKIKDQFENALKKEKDKIMRMSLRLFVRGLMEAKIDKNDAVKVPTWLVRWLGKGKLRCRKDKMGIKVFISKKGREE